MKKHWPLFLIATGLLMAVGDLIFLVWAVQPGSGFPTPSQKAQEEANQHLFMTILWVSMGLIVVGMVAGVLRWIIGFSRK